MPPGRKAIPISQHKLKGTYRKDRHGKAQAIEQLDCGLPECPDWLSDRARAAWTYIAPLLEQRRIATKADRIAVELLCVDYAEYMDLQRDVELEGHTYTTTTQMGDKMQRPNPKVAMRDMAWRRLQSDMANFGLSPAARNKVSAIAKDGGDDPWRDL